MKLASIVGARPQFIKLAPLVKAFHRHRRVSVKGKKGHILIHTGQHYDYRMDKVFFEELGIPEPDYNLGVGSGPQGWQTGEMIRRAEQVLMEESPEFVLVYGDTNSTLAGAMAAVKLGIRVAHIESGLRSYNREMPEEINRILTDRCSNILFCPTENACENLRKEGFSDISNNGKLVELDSQENFSTGVETQAVINVGDIMYDSVLLGLETAKKKSDVLERLQLETKKYYLATVHRAENSDNKERMKRILDALNEISKEKPVIFPVHPRTTKNLEAFRLRTSRYERVRMISPVSYFDMLILEKNALKIMTDSGGMQKEAYFFEVPCVTLREETEWIETLAENCNVLAGTNNKKISQTALASQTSKPSAVSPFGDGHTSERILNILSHTLLS